MGSGSVPDRRWNHNLQFHAWILEHVPPDCEHALDVGCGDGVLTAKLAERSRVATGIDASEAMVALARNNVGAANARFVVGDFLTAPLVEHGYDFIAAVAVIHHVELARALSRLGALLRAGGVLCVVGLARNRTLADWSFSAVSVPVAVVADRLRGAWASPAPVRDPEQTLGEIRAAARRLLPGADIRRRLFYRYTLLWRKHG